MVRDKKIFEGRQTCLGKRGWIQQVLPASCHFPSVEQRQIFDDDLDRESSRGDIEGLVRFGLGAGPREEVSFGESCPAFGRFDLRHFSDGDQKVKEFVNLVNNVP